MAVKLTATPAATDRQRVGHAGGGRDVHQEEAVR